MTSATITPPPRIAYFTVRLGPSRSGNRRERSLGTLTDDELCMVAHGVTQEIERRKAQRELVAAMQAP